MPFTLVLPDGFQYLGAAFASTIWLQVWQALLVGRARKAAGIQYPRLYAEKAEEEASFLAKKFNCTQRAHQNTLEQMPLICTATALSALKYPTFAAGALGLWTVGRVLYTLGYITGDPSKRQARGGWIGSLCFLALASTGTYVAGALALGH
ncbi:membrane-associated proteins in eicosanoid and glutathione metabolism [Schizophyllum commune Tattone D]|uniref:Membrane-associated proteins in eicosanoid and glutathione metabolism n=2 Tax=Schizophyllum commune (strain H4-8 / FGSC 9210) TaxID=578458 RepID=D8PS96_SCHCM